MRYLRLLCHFLPKWANYVINELAKLATDHYWANLGGYAIFELTKHTKSFLGKKMVSVGHFRAILGKIGHFGAR